MNKSSSAKHEEYELYKNIYPWRVNYNAARGRCLDRSHKNYSRYGGAGIKFLMTIDDFKFLWFRDKAYLMEKPSIDRLDNKGDYTVSNCRYREFKENCGDSDKSVLIKRLSKPVLQLGIGGERVKLYSSLHEAGIATNTCWQNIWKVIKGKRPLAGGFRWQYA